jgi:hypothetical protein
LTVRVDDLFEVTYGNSLSLNQLARQDEGRGVAFVSRTAQNNGIAAWVEPLPDVEPFPPGYLTVSLRSRNHALATFLQVRPFYTAYHLFVLIPRRQMSVKERLWWAQCIESNRYRYNYGRQANRSLAALKLPDELPAWVKEAPLPIIDPAPIRVEQVPMPELNRWRQFSIDSLFALHRGGGQIRRESKEGDTPLVSASAKNNGVTKRVAVEAKFPAGWITVCSNGSVGEAFVQTEPFVATADVTVLEPKIPAGIGARLFLCALIRHEKYRFNYGRKWPAGRLAGSRIWAPALPGGQPDLEFMEQFFEALPFSRFVALE